jgi:hypothetical protein
VRGAFQSPVTRPAPAHSNAPSREPGALLCRVEARPRGLPGGAAARGRAVRILPDGDAQGVMTLDTTAPASLIEAGAAACCGHVLARPLPPQAGLSEDVPLGSSQMAMLKVL